MHLKKNSSAPADVSDLAKKKQALVQRSAFSVIMSRDLSRWCSTATSEIKRTPLSTSFFSANVRFQPLKGFQRRKKSCIFNRSGRRRRINSIPLVLSGLCATVMDCASHSHQPRVAHAEIDTSCLRKRHRERERESGETGAGNMEGR